MKKIVSLTICALLFTSCDIIKKREYASLLHKKIESKFQKDIADAIAYADSIESHYDNATYHFKKSREAFKKIEMVLASLDANNYATLNQPNILKVREDDYTDIKLISPLGYQVLEEALFAENIDLKVVKENAVFIKNRLKIVEENVRFDHLKKYHFLWMLKKQIARIAFTGITGFDSPVLESSLYDSRVAYAAARDYIKLLKDEFNDQNLFEMWLKEFDTSIADLKGSFNGFDRYYFIKNHTHKQLDLFLKTVNDWNVTFPFTLELNDNANSFFSSSTFNLEKFADFKTRHVSSEKVALGQKLFYDTSLSRSKKISCATCHQPEKGFTDGLTTPAGLSRNSPTLLYAALQKGFFYDKRTGGLEGQIVDVIQNEDEFHTDFHQIERIIKENKEYSEMYMKAFPDKETSAFYIRNAIATYLRTLTPFDSKFDRNINGSENTMTNEEILGFNLFNGKAKCATCHFAPVFNGTIPPDFKETEMELIGTPEKNDTINAIISKDLGRYHVYKTQERKHFFKTPTVRNVENTGPFMHNGVYNTLEEVVDFYNRGGGAGIGIDQELQTLPPDNLNLTKEEQNAIVAFLKTLTDKSIEVVY